MLTGGTGWQPSLSRLHYMAETDASCAGCPSSARRIRYAKIHGTEHRPWLTALLARRPTKVAAIALANKLARMAWAVIASHALIPES
jgi:transposase